MSLPVQTRQNWISEDPDYSIRRQCRLAGISRNSFYYEPMVESEENLHLMRLIDRRYLDRPDYGSPRMTDWLQDQGYGVNRNFCVVALERAMSRGEHPQIFNTDQGAQFTSKEFTEVLQSRDIAISMDGRGRALDNVFIERLWWTVKYEDIYAKDYLDGKSLFDGLTAYFRYYNEERKHSKLDKQTPAQVYFN